MSKYCSECGTEIPEGSKFCPNCGFASGASGGAGNQQTSASVTDGKTKDATSKVMTAIKVIGATLAILIVIGLIFGGVDEDYSSSTSVPATTPAIMPTTAPVVATAPATRPTSATPTPTPTSSLDRVIFLAPFGLGDSDRVTMYPNGDAVWHPGDDESDILRTQYRSSSPDVYMIDTPYETFTIRLYSDGTCITNAGGESTGGVWSYNKLW